MSDPFYAYTTYLAVKQHFKDPKYDFFKYNGKVSAGRKAFESRNDKWFFVKLIKHHPEMFDLALFIAINFYYDPKCYVKTLVNSSEPEKRYNEVMGRLQTMEYSFRKEMTEIIRKVDGDLMEYVSHDFLSDILSERLSPEAAIVLNAASGGRIFKHFDSSSDVVWEHEGSRLKKYASFIRVDADKYRDILKEISY